MIIIIIKDPSNLQNQLKKYCGIAILEMKFSGCTLKIFESVFSFTKISLPFFCLVFGDKQFRKSVIIKIKDII